MKMTIRTIKIKNSIAGIVSYCKTRYSPMDYFIGIKC
jgi:hypothetical protein